jgi:hypothetical protein
MAPPTRGSRYAGSRRVEIVGPAGEALVLLAPRVVPEPRTRGIYQARSSDRLDLLARAAFGDSTQWWVLADANPWADATALEAPGTDIRLPDE